MAERIRAACVQLNAGPDIADNLTQAEAIIRLAAKDGAQFIVTPENTCRMRSDNEGRWAASYTAEDHPALPFYAELAKELSVSLLIGSISSIRVGEKKLANRSCLFNEQGQVVATYDKIHMFDVDLPNGDRYRESEMNKPGERAVTAILSSGIKVGLSVCYDLRFPHLYRALANQGAQILCIPSAFTVPTGQAHWEVLLRARAIENGCYVMAPAQCGTHQGGRQTWGHSLIVAPWGQIVAQRSEDTPGYIIADLDMAEVEKARAAVPSLKHDRNYL